MEGLGEDFRLSRRLIVGIEGDRRETGDEHHLDVGIELGRAASELDAVHLRHDDVGEQQLERLDPKLIIGGRGRCRRT